MPKLPYVVLDVFTETRFSGNQLAIVDATSISLSDRERQEIALEFGFSETVFTSAPTTNGHIPIRIYDPFEEIPFAGHPVIGTSYHFLSGTPGLEEITLITGAGKVTAWNSPNYDKSIEVSVPHDFKIHELAELPWVTSNQPDLSEDDFVAKDNRFPVVSIVKGMTFILIELKSGTALRRLQPYARQPTLPEGHIGAWDIGTAPSVYAYVHDEKLFHGDGRHSIVLTRMFYGPGKEDAATGSAACALFGYLTSSAERNWECITFRQGVDMGRASNITVRGNVREKDGLSLVGQAVKTMEGLLEI